MIKVSENLIPVCPRFAKQYNLKLVLAKLGNPEKLIPTINVVGTNGKGSTATFFSQGLRQKFKKVGLFISPAFLYHNERIQINNQPISDEDLQSYLRKIKPLISEYHLTFFEIWTLVMILYFRAEKVEVAVVEAGIGGQLDATNVMSHQLLVVLTSVGFDHTEILGSSISEILTQKLGIAQLSTPVLISADNRKYAPEIDQISAAKNLKITWAGVNEKAQDYQKANQGLVVEGLKKLGIVDVDPQNWTPPLGRLTVLNSTPKLIIDGAHNLDAIKKLVLAVKGQSLNPLILFATSFKKDYQPMLDCLNKNFGAVYITGFDHLKAWSIKEIDYPLKVSDWQKFLWENKNRDILVCGSLYFIPQVYQWYNQKN